MFTSRRADKMVVRLLLVITFISSGLLIGSLPVKGAQQRRIFGIVIDAGSRSPLVHANVTLWKLNSDWLAIFRGAGIAPASTRLSSTETDQQGRFSFITTSNGPFEISVFDRVTRARGVVQVKRTDTAVEILTTKAPPPADVRPPR